MISELKRIGPVGIRDVAMPAVCAVYEGHKHNYDHTTIVIHGRVKVAYRYEKDGRLVEGETREYGSGGEIAIKAGVYHTITVLGPPELDEEQTAAAEEIRRLMAEHQLSFDDIALDASYKCVYSHRDKDGIVSQSYTGHQEAYC